MGKVVINKCQFCGNDSFIKGRNHNSYYGKIILKGKLLGNNVEHTICDSCGSIVNSRVLNLKTNKKEA